LSDGLFYGEEIPEEYEFIKKKCDEAGLCDVFEKYQFNLFNAIIV